MRFLFYDKIIHIEKGQRIHGVKNVSLTESFFVGHFEKQPIVPAGIIIEAIAQVAGWLINYTYDFRVSAIMSLIEGARSYGNVSPGSQLMLEAELTATRDDGSTASGRALLDNETIMDVERILFVHYTPPNEAFIEGEKERFQYMSGGYPVSGE